MFRQDEKQVRKEVKKQNIMGAGAKNISNLRKTPLVRWSIGTRLTLAFLILAIIPMSLVAYYNLTNGRNEVTKLAKRGLITLSHSTADVIEQILIENMRNSAMLAGDPLTKQFMAASEKDRQTLSPQLYKMLENFVDTHPDYDSPGLLDANGIVVAALEETLVGKDRSFRGYFQASIKGKPYISNILIGRATGRPGVFLTNPVISEEGKIIGIVILWLKADTIWQIIDNVKVGKEGIAYLIDQDGVIIAHPSRELLYHSIGELSSETISIISSTSRFGTIKDTKKPVIPKNLGMEKLAAQIASAQNPNTYYYSSSINHQYHVVGYSPLEKQPWTVVIDLPEVQFLAPLNQMITVAYASIGLVAIITIIISILLAKSITLPIRRLTEISIDVKHDRRSFHPSTIEDVIKGHDEIAHLGHMFSGMVLSLRESEEKYRSMMEATEDLVSICSPDHRIEYLNPAMIKRTGRDATGELCHKVIHGFDEKCPWCNLEKVMKGKSTSYEIISPKDNKTYSIVNSPIFHLDGSISELTVFRDVTELKKMESQLLQAQKMESIGTLAGGIAHDFNNILFPVIGHTEMLLEDVSEDSPFRNSLKEIYASALRAKDLVKQILTFSRQDTNELKLIKMLPIVKEALKLIRSTIPTTIEIKHDFNPDCGIIKADPTQIHQIVMNLATNAYHAMEETGGVMKVSLKEIELGEHELIAPDMIPGVYACLIVADTGKGMDKNLTDKIFDPFFTTKAIGKGTGMGLSVVHGIVTVMGGYIQVYSNPGKGTQFHVYLPVEKSLSEKQKTNSTTEEIQGGIEQILLVDDEEAILTMEKLMLERLGYQVISRTSSLEALEAFRADPDKFDLIITDMAMPNMRGDKLSAELIKIRPDIPVLLCTGFSEAMSEKKARSLGIKGFLMKPIVMKDLAQKIHEVLDENLS